MVICFTRSILRNDVNKIPFDLFPAIFNGLIVTSQSHFSLQTDGN